MKAFCFFSILRSGNEQARLEGVYDKGKEDKAYDIARKLLSNNIVINIITKSTGLTQKEIEELAKEIE